MIKAKWREGFGFYSGVDAQQVADEIMAIGEAPTAHDILDKAKDAETELHKCFEWDDTIAAGKYRIIQARHIVRNLVIVQEDEEPDRQEIRMFYKTAEHEGYKPTVIIVKKQDEYTELLNRAYSELRAFKQKYAILQELQEIFDLID